MYIPSSFLVEDLPTLHAPAAPTWNYTAVRAHGRLTIIQAHNLASALLKEIEHG
jgi:predicted FMN-binding regulatory protein PaiB